MSEKAFDLVTRLEIVDHTPCKNCNGLGWFYAGQPVDPKKYKGTVRPDECENCGGVGTPGRSVVFWNHNKQIELSLQDDDRTLKIFISKRGK